MITITITEIGETARFDLLRVDFSPEATVTEHPVELGAEVSDHAQVRPYRFAAEVIVTASPRSPVPQPFAIEDAVGFFERAVGKLLTVVIDGEGTFSNMVLEAAGHSRETVGRRIFSCRFKYVRIAAAISVPIPPRLPAPVAAAGAPTEAPLGQQATTPGVPVSGLKAIKDATPNPLSVIGGFIPSLF